MLDDCHGSVKEFPLTTTSTAPWWPEWRDHLLLAHPNLHRQEAKLYIHETSCSITVASTWIAKWVATASSGRLVADAGALMDLYSCKRIIQRMRGHIEKSPLRDGIQDPAGHDNRSRVMYAFPSAQHADSVFCQGKHRVFTKWDIPLFLEVLNPSKLPPHVCDRGDSKKSSSCFSRYLDAHHSLIRPWRTEVPHPDSPHLTGEMIRTSIADSSFRLGVTTENYVNNASTSVNDILLSIEIQITFRPQWRTCTYWALWVGVGSDNNIRICIP